MIPNPPRRARSASSRGVLHGLLLLLCAALLAWPAFAAKNESKRSSKKGKSDEEREIGFYATTVGRSSQEIILVQYWSKGNKFRAETIVAGHPIITVVRGDEYYTWDELTSEGYVIKRTDAAIDAQKGRSRPFGLELEQLLAAGGELIRSETLGGVRVDVYRVTDDSGRRTLWVDSDRGNLPIRLETYSRATGRTGHLDWVKWLPGIVIPDSFFEPRKGLALKKFDSYEAYLGRLARGPLPPTPPLFHYLLHEPNSESE